MNILGYIIYNIIYTIIFILLFPLYLIYNLGKAKYRKTFKQRLGIHDSQFYCRLKDKKVIWLHAASVGEMFLAKEIYKRLKNENYNFLISTTTHSGLKVAEESFDSKGVQVSLLPIDIFWMMGNFAKKINPGYTILVETNLWPNFIYHLNKYSKKVIMVNSYFDKNDLYDHFILPGLIKEVMAKIDYITLQSANDSERISSYISREKLEVTGNMKIDVLASEQQEQKPNNLRRELKIKDKQPVFIAGSTHKGEEELILNAYQKLINYFPDLILIIAPRHIERVDELINICHKSGFSAHRKTNLVNLQGRKNNIIILDTLGELRYFYSAADISFVGGTLIKKGGHNLLEPVINRSPVLFGPYHKNFRQIADLIVDYEAGYEVAGALELEEKVKELLSNHQKIKEIQKGAVKLINDHSGALEKNIQVLKECLS